MMIARKGLRGTKTMIEEFKGQRVHVQLSRLEIEKILNKKKIAGHKVSIKLENE